MTTNTHGFLGIKLGDPPDRKHMVHAAVTVGIIFAVIWIVQFINVADNYGLNPVLGIQPHVWTSLPNIFTAPFLHMSWQHIEGNSIPLLVLGFLAAYRGLVKFAWVTVTIIVVSGLFVWLVTPAGGYTIGASGVIAGWLGYVVLRGLFERCGIDMMVGGVAGFIYLGAFEFVPNNQGISWQGHLSGLVVGMLCAGLISDRPLITALNKKVHTLTTGRGKPIAVISATILIIAATAGTSLAAAMSTSPQSAPPVAAQPAPTYSAPADPAPTAAPTTPAPVAPAPAKTVYVPVQAPAAPAPPVQPAYFTNATSVVTQFYQDINNGDYSDAWALGGDNIGGGAYSGWVAGYDTTASVSVGTFSALGSDQVQTSLSAVQDDGTTKTYEGTYTVSGGVIVAANIVQTG
jgi:membrane associated rhomboid family serine protease